MCLYSSIQPLMSLAWQREGKKFISAHKDSSIYYWSITSSSPEEGPKKHYGKAMKPLFVYFNSFYCLSVCM